MIMFMAYDGKVKPVQTSKANRYQGDLIWVDGMLQEITTDWCSYHETWKEAKAAIIERAMSDVFDCGVSLSKANMRLHKAQNLLPIRQNRFKMQSLPFLRVKRSHFDSKALTSPAAGKSWDLPLH